MKSHHQQQHSQQREVEHSNSSNISAQLNSQQQQQEEEGGVQQQQLVRPPEHSPAYMEHSLYPADKKGEIPWNKKTLYVRSQTFFIFKFLTAKTKYRNFDTYIPRKGISGSQSQFPHSRVWE
jgi:hypothetical protein